VTSAAEPRRTGRTGPALAFLAALLAFGYFARRPWNPNENSRMAPVLAAFWHHTLAIDGYWASGPVQTNDRSESGGRTYSDKAPGSSVLAALGYAPVYAWERATGTEARYVIRKYAMTVAAVGLPLALALAALFALARSAAGPRAAAAVVAVALLASPLLPYGSVLFGHGLAAALLLGAFAVIRFAVTGPVRPVPASHLAGAGALLAGAIAVEYPTAPAALVLGLYALHRLHGRGELARARSLLLPLCGAAPVALGLGLYNWACFGSPLSPGYAHLTVPMFRAVHAQGVLGVGLPRLGVLYYLTVHPARGLFVHAPVLLLALPGLWFMARRPGWRAEAITCAAVFVSLLLLNAGFGFWWGGYTYTARHVVPAIPFLLVPLAFLPRRALWVGMPLFLLSAAQVLPATFGDPFTSDGRLMAQLRLAQASGGLAPWRGAWSIGEDAWPALVRREGGGWPGFAPNGARLLDLTGPATVLPFLALVIAPLLLAARAARRRAPVAAPARAAVVERDPLRA